MVEKRRQLRRSEDVAAAHIMRLARLLLKVSSVLVGVYVAGVALAITAKGAWVEMLRAFK